MIPRCHAIRNTNRYLITTLLLVCRLFDCVSADNTVAECNVVLIAATIGTFIVCAVISLGLILYLRRCLKRGESVRVSKRRGLPDSGPVKESLHFENNFTVSPVSETTDGFARDTSSDWQPINERSVENSLAFKLELVDSSTQTSDYDTGKQKEQVMIEKRCDGSVGLKLSIAGLFVLNICDDLSVKSGSCIEPGDEVLSINGVDVEGMSDMEAHAMLAKSGPFVLLEIVKHSCLWQVEHLGDQRKLQDSKRSQKISTSPVCVGKEAALKRAKIEMDEALMELRRTTSTSFKDSQLQTSKHRENSSPYQSLTSSVEVQEPIAEEEDFVVIDCKEIAKSDRVAQTAKGNDTALSSKISIDDSDNIAARLAKPKGLPNGNLTSHENKTGHMKPDCNTDAFTTTRQTATEQLSKRHELDASQDVPVSVQDQHTIGQELSLSSSSVSSLPKKSSPSDDRNRCAAYTPLKVASPANVPDRSDLMSLPPNYYVPYDVKTTQFSSSSYDMDKISPPPSYQVASQIFNTQKPGVRGDGTGQRVNVVSSVNGCSSQGSSFDEIDSDFPLLLPKACRESLGIDEHVMRYMTKKYSEPRLQAAPARNGVATSAINGPRCISQESRMSAYMASQNSVTDRLFVTHSSMNSTRSGEIDVIASVPSHTVSPASQSVIVLSQSLSQPIVFSANGPYEYGSNDDEHIGPIGQGQASIVEMPGVMAAVQSRTESHDQSSILSTDYDNEMLSVNGIEGLNISPRVTPVGQQRKALSSSRVSKFLRQRGAHDSSSESIRRATSSPSVSSDHDPNGVVELEAGVVELEAGIGPGTAQGTNKRNTHKTRDDFMDRRKSIDSGSLRKLAAELQANQNLSDDFPMLSKLLGGAGLPDLENSTNLPRYRSSDTLYGKF